MFNGTKWHLDRSVASWQNLAAKVSRIVSLDDGPKYHSLYMEDFILPEILALSHTQDTPYFFAFKYYDPIYSSELLEIAAEDPAWLFLERKLGTRLVRLNDFHFRDFSPIATDPEYLFLICWYPDEVKESATFEAEKQQISEACTAASQRSLPSYGLVKTLWGNPNLVAHVLRDADFNR